MSKSKGAILTVSLLKEKGYDPLVYRFFCLQSYYRKPLEFSFEALDNVTGVFNKLVRRIAELKEDGAVDEAAKAKFEESFADAVCGDLNTSMAITVLYDVLKADINDATKLALVESFDKVLSLDLIAHAKSVNEGGSVDAELEKYILDAIERRAQAKKAKDFATADAIRAELLEKGVEIKDTREGVKWQLI
jgi:cysteinyl-tRNA synthetase